jgi:hypothetical protein
VLAQRRDARCESARFAHLQFQRPVLTVVSLPTGFAVSRESVDTV